MLPGGMADPTPYHLLREGYPSDGCHNRLACADVRASSPSGFLGGTALLFLKNPLKCSNAKSGRISLQRTFLRMVNLHLHLHGEPA